MTKEEKMIDALNGLQALKNANIDLNYSENEKKLNSQLDEIRLNQLKKLLVLGKEENIQADTLTNRFPKKYTAFIRGKIKITESYNDQKWSKTTIHILLDNNDELDYEIASHFIKFSKTSFENNCNDAKVMEKITWESSKEEMSYIEQGYCFQENLRITTEARGENHFFTVADNVHYHFSDREITSDYQNLVNDYICYEFPNSVEFMDEMLGAIDHFILNGKQYLKGKNDKLDKILEKYQIKNIIKDLTL